MKTIGITGGVGAGKSEVLSLIKDNSNCRIVLADKLAKQLENRGNECYEAIVALLGENILDENKQIIPARMAEKIFSEEHLLSEVNNIVHPAVKSKILEYIDDEEKRGEIDFFFVEAALLIEEGYDLIFDELWYIYADDEVRRRRLKDSRNYSDEKIDRIFASQLDDETFRRYCSVVIDNSGDMEETKQQILKLLNNRENNI